MYKPNGSIPINTWRLDPSPLVRLTIASLLQRVPADQRLRFLEEYLTSPISSEDKDDPNIPLMLWYAVTDADAPDMAKAAFAARSRIPLLLRFMARRLAERIDKPPVGNLLDFGNPFLSSSKSTSITPLLSFGRDLPGESQAEILAGMTDALRGRREVPMPDGWNVFREKLASIQDEHVREAVRELDVLFGDSRALNEMSEIALDRSANEGARGKALKSMIDARARDLRATCEALLNRSADSEGESIRGIAARGLATVDDPAVWQLSVEKYREFRSIARGEIIAALAARATSASVLLDAIAADKIPRSNLSAFHARQIRAFNDDALTKRLAEVWGEVRGDDESKKTLIAKLKTQLTPEVLAKADLPAGRALFTQTCAACHKLHGEGGAFGPDITGSARDQLSYLIENIADPSAIVPVDFRMSIVTMKDGRVLTGFVGGKTERGFTLRGLTDTQTIERAEVREIADSPQSLMPEGILSALNETQVRDLIGYLQAKSQVPLPNTAAGK